MHILLTALGTGAPRLTEYDFNEQKYQAEFAPLALLQGLDELQRPDVVRVLVTEAARASTWEVFRTQLLDSWGIEAEAVDIPNGVNQGEIAFILHKVAQAVPAGSRLTVDVTHGLRHFPFIAYSAAIYFTALRNVKLEGMYYGVIEANPKRIIDLQHVVDLPKWFHAIQSFEDTGITNPIANLLREQSERLKPNVPPSYDTKELYAPSRRVTKNADLLSELSFAYEGALPLELGKAAKLMGEALREEPNVIGLGGLALADELRDRLLDIINDTSCEAHGSRTWKNDMPLVERELQRQAFIIDQYLERKQYPLAFGLMREWVVSAVAASNGAKKWVNYSDRQPSDRSIKSLVSYYKKYGSGACLTNIQSMMALFVDQLTEIRNKFAHHGMNEQELTLKDCQKAISKLQELWIEIREHYPYDLDFGGGKGRMLISPQGTTPGVLYSAICAAQENDKLDTCLVICSEQSKQTIADAATRAGFSGELIPLVLDDVFAGYAQLNSIINKVEDNLIQADEVVVNITGGTTFMAHIAQSFFDKARWYGRDAQRFALIDKRPHQEQKDNPFVAGEVFWLE